MTESNHTLSNTLPATRDEAKRQGVKHYFTGEPCKHGHITKRLASSGCCVDCRKLVESAWRKKNIKYCLERERKYRAENRESRIKNSRKWYKNNRDHALEYAKKYHQENRDVLLEKGKEWREKNKDTAPERYRESYIKHRDKKIQYAREYRNENREVVLERTRRWAKNNPEYIRAYNGTKRAIKRQAMPKWADRNAIAAIYRKARELEKQDGIPRHVDHIIPLVHPLVCGLHCPENLQILTAEENLRKNNKFEVIIE